MKIGILGATGEVGRMMIQILQERQCRPKKLSLFASERSEGQQVGFFNELIKVQRVTKEALNEKFDFLLFSAGGDASKKYAPNAENAGNVVIDNSSAFRKTHPLIVPEVNGHLIDNYKGIVANPNCSTIQVVIPLYYMHLLYELEEVVISTYQSVSGAGHKGIAALNAEKNKNKTNSPFPKEIDGNVIPQIGEFDHEGHSEEELKMTYEIKKILNITNLKIAVTTVRIPVYYGHSESVFARFKKEASITEIEKAFTKSDSIEYQKNGYLTPKELLDSDKSFVGRLRKGPDKHSVQFWNVAHNIRLGAATNAVNIMQYMLNNKIANKR